MGLFYFMQEQEIWKPIVGLEGIYEISSLGRVKSLSRLYNTGNKLAQRIKEENILKPKASKVGYLVVTLSMGTRKDRKTVKVHRLIANAFIPNPKNKPQVNHIDGNKINNSISNLEWSTAKENVHHAIGMGLRSSVGSNNVKAKYKESDVLEIRRLFASGVKNKDIHKLYPKLSYESLAQITNRITWKHL